MTNRENKAAASEFRELFGIDFDEFTRQAAVGVLLALAKFAEPVDIAGAAILGREASSFSAAARTIGASAAARVAA